LCRFLFLDTVDVCYVNISFYAYRICYDSLTFHFVGNLKNVSCCYMSWIYFRLFSFPSFLRISWHTRKKDKISKISLRKTEKGTEKKRKFVWKVHLFLEKLYCYATYLPPYDSKNYFVFSVLRSFSFFLFLGVNHKIYLWFLFDFYFLSNWSYESHAYVMFCEFERIGILLSRLACHWDWYGVIERIWARLSIKITYIVL